MSYGNNIWVYHAIRILIFIDVQIILLSKNQEIFFYIHPDLSGIG
jgi:hypothetical protein